MIIDPALIPAAGRRAQAQLRLLLPLSAMPGHCLLLLALLLQLQPALCQQGECSIPGTAQGKAARGAQPREGGMLLGDSCGRDSWKGKYIPVLPELWNTSWGLARDARWVEGF